MRYSEQICPRYQHAIEILARRWTGLILKILMAGPLRFSELAERLEVVSDRVLSERLKDLEGEGLLERRVFAETPVRVEYSLTAKGHAMRPVIEAIAAWGEQWVDPPQQ
jgi:DNA-binding HxlR family transcriptional regulator